MNPLLLIEWQFPSDSPREVAPLMAADLVAIATAISRGESNGETRNAHWTIHTDVSYAEIKEALSKSS